MTKQYNIVWAIVDSVRHYHTPGDDRTRLDFMDEFALVLSKFDEVYLLDIYPIQIFHYCTDCTVDQK